MGFNRSSFAFSDDCKRAVAFLYLSLPHTVPAVSAYILTPYVFVFPTGLILLSALSYTFAAVDEQMYSYKKNNKLTLLVFVPFSLSICLTALVYCYTTSACAELGVYNGRHGFTSRARARRKSGRGLAN